MVAKNTLFGVRALTIELLLLPAAAVAHHGLAVFDETSPMTLEGTVTEFHFTNPHCVIDFEVTNGKGQTQKWQAELTSPLHLKGWTAASLEPGNKVKITGYRARSGAYYLWTTKLISSNGRELNTRATR